MNALVTGASSGIGRELARQLAQRGYTVVCCARSSEPLEKLSEETQGRCRAFPIDLSAQGASEAVRDYCRKEQLFIETLVNCAGFGAVGHHVRHTAESLAEMCRLNVNTPTELCAIFGQGMRERRRGFILNVSSVAGFMPIPYFANYSASKAFIRSLSDSLHEELRPYDVMVCCLSPGPVRTSFHARSNPNYSGDEKSLFSLCPTEVAEAGLRGLFGGKRSVVPGVANRCCIWMEHFLPRSLVSRFLARKSLGRKLTD
jgi:short-subunit dehydrogenase